MDLYISDSQRLNHIITQVKTIAIDSHNHNHKNKNLSKKLEDYNKTNILITEASRLIEKLENEIMAMNNVSATNDPQIGNNIQEFIDLLSDSTINFDENMYIIEQLKLINAGLPTTTQIIDNVQQDQSFVYEAEEL